MRSGLTFVLIIALSGCALTPTQKKWTGIAAGVLIVGGHCGSRGG